MVSKLRPTPGAEHPMVKGRQWHAVNPAAPEMRQELKRPHFSFEIVYLERRATMLPRLLRIATVCYPSSQSLSGYCWPGLTGNFVSTGTHLVAFQLT